jgi:hypothetical protein
MTTLYPINWNKIQDISDMNEQLSGINQEHDALDDHQYAPVPQPDPYEALRFEKNEYK